MKIKVILLFVEMKWTNPQLIHNILPYYSLDHSTKTHYLVIRAPENPYILGFLL